MDSIKYLACIMVYQTFCMGNYTADNCEKCVIKKMINGYSCPTANRTTEHSNVPHHLCSHHCVSVGQWSMLSYHINKAVCLLYKDICVELVDDEGQVISSIILNRSSPHACISWPPYQGNIPAGEWLRHPMTAFFFAKLALCEGNPPVTAEFPPQKPVTRSSAVFFDLRRNKRLGKQSRRWWFETPSPSLWRQGDVNGWYVAMK